MRSLRYAAATWLLTSAPLLAGEATPGDLIRGLRVSASGHEVRVAGVSPGGAVVLMGVAREPLPGAAQVESWLLQLPDDDRDGQVTLELTRAVPFKSAWLAIDLATGQSGGAAGEEFPLDTVLPGPAGFSFDRSLNVPLIRLDRATVHFALIRPGIGAWAAKAYDGGDADIGNPSQGVPDGVLQVDPRAFLPLKDGLGRFPGLGSADRIGAIDEKSLTLFMLRGADAPGLD